MISVNIIIALLIYVYMLIHVYKCEGEVECLSDIAYDKHSRLFPICMILISILLFVGMYVNTPNSYAWACAIPCISIIGVAFTPYKDNKIKHHIHYAFALTSFLSAFILWALAGMWYVPILFCLAALRKKMLLGLEMGLLASSFMYILK